MRLVFKTRLHSARASSCGGLRMLVPALLTGCRAGRSAGSTSSTMRATAPSSPTSTVRAKACAATPLEILHRLARLLLVASDDHHLRARRGETARHAEPDPAVAARHHRHLALEIEHARPSAVWGASTGPAAPPPLGDGPGNPCRPSVVRRWAREASTRARPRSYAWPGAPTSRGSSKSLFDCRVVYAEWGRCGRWGVDPRRDSGGAVGGSRRTAGRGWQRAPGVE